MNLSEPFIRRPVMTTLVMLALLTWGLISYFKLPVSDLPNVDRPMIQVRVPYTGIDASTLANTVVNPLEREFMTISGIEEVTSSSSSGYANISLKFRLDKNMDTACQEVQAAIDAAKLPRNMPERPRYSKENPAMQPIMYLALCSNSMETSALYDYADHSIVQRISSIPGIADVKVWGSQYAMRIQLNPEALAAYNLDIEEITQAVKRANPSLPLGKLDNDQFNFVLRSSGRLRTVEDFEKIIIKQDQNLFLQLKDVATVLEGVESDEMYFRYTTPEKEIGAIILAIRRQPGSNTVALSKGIKLLLPEIHKELPPSVELNILLDKSLSIDESLTEVKDTLILSIVLVIVVIFFYLASVKDTLVPALAIPLSIITTFGIIYWLGYSIDVLSLLALTLSTGFVVDDAIVVMENIVRHREMGKTSSQAALDGSKEISFTVLSMTISLVAVLIPLLFMQGMLGKLFQEFSVTLALSILISGFVSLSLTPMLCSRLKFEHSQKQEKGAIQKTSDMINNGLLKFYQPWLQRVLKYRRTTFSIGFFCLILTIVLFRFIPIEFLPQEDSGMMQGWVRAEQGAGQVRLEGYLNQVNRTLQLHPAIEYIVSGTASSSSGCWAYIQLKPKDQRVAIDQIITDIQNKLATIPGIQSFYNAVPILDLATGDGNTSQSYEYFLKSYVLDDLYASGKKLTEALQKSPYFTDVNGDFALDYPEVRVSVMTEKAQLLGVDVEKVQTLLGLAYANKEISKIQTDRDEYPVILEVSPSVARDAFSLNKLYVRSSTTGQVIPLNALTKVQETVGAQSINHVNQSPYLRITFNVAKGRTLDAALTELENIANSILPDTVTGSIEGAAKFFTAYSNHFWGLILIAAGVMYLVLGILYESFIHPITILSTLPFAVLGAAITLLVCQQSLSLYGFIGLILLMGIVKKNGIMLVDHALEVLRHKPDTKPEEAIYEACIIRFRPIMMTTAAAIIGALPIALGYGSQMEARQTLGLVIVGGLLFSQLLTLLFTPVLYLYLNRWHKQY
ncbi:MAG: acriflavin resistance protein [Chlamydiales bacterium]|jgi:HAE1 family hydrophobic/amphiphilic exporter-1|nr:acriflavin resistance protein [Chlamydiales bacterium]